MASWYRKRIGSGRITALYHLQKYIDHRIELSLDADPEHWLEGCLNGNNRTLVQHLKTLKDWCEGGTFYGSNDDTRTKYYR